MFGGGTNLTVQNPFPSFSCVVIGGPCFAFLVPQTMAYDATSANFKLLFVANPHATAPTEIYLNEALHYPAGFTCVVTGGSCTHAGTNRVVVDNTPGAQQVAVSITPK